jgi:hypothetical protein
MRIGLRGRRRAQRGLWLWMACTLLLQALPTVRADPWVVQPTGVATSLKHIDLIRWAHCAPPLQQPCLSSNSGCHCLTVGVGVTLVLRSEQGWAVGEANTVLYTEDGGSTWAPQHTTALNSTVWWSCSFGAGTGGAWGWLAGSDGRLASTTDGGDSWTLHAPAPSTALFSIHVRTRSPPQRTPHRVALGCSGVSANACACCEGVCSLLRSVSPHASPGKGHILRACVRVCVSQLMHRFVFDSAPHRNMTRAAHIILCVCSASTATATSAGGMAHSG